MNKKRSIYESPHQIPRYYKERLLHQHDPHYLEEHRYLNRLKRSEMSQDKNV